MATNRGDRWVFVFGFPKNARSNIDKDEHEALKKLADHLMGLSSVGMQSAVKAGGLIEMNCDEKD